MYLSIAKLLQAAITESFQIFRTRNRAVALCPLLVAWVCCTLIYTHYLYFKFCDSPYGMASRVVIHFDTGYICNPLITPWCMDPKWVTLMTDHLLAPARHMHQINLKWIIDYIILSLFSLPTHSATVVHARTVQLWNHLCKCVVSCEWKIWLHQV